VLSKSQLLCYLQCPKKLWLSVHREDLSNNDSEGSNGFTAGQKVGDVVRRVFDPKGTGEQVDVQALGLDRAYLRSQQLLGAGEAIFEGGYSAAGASYLRMCCSRWERVVRRPGGWWR